MYVYSGSSYICCLFFFFSSRRRHTRFDCDWSSDVCSSDLRLFLDGKSALCPSPSSRRKTASRASTRRSTPLKRGERDCGVGLSVVVIQAPYRSEERRVGKECRSRWSPYH